jgi:superfamily II DNA or RNA helicase
MKLTLLSPTRAFLSNYTPDELHDLRKALTYTNTSVKHLIKRHYSNVFFKSRNLEAWTEHLQGLQKDLKKTLVFEEDGQLYIRPGSIPYLQGFDLEIENLIQYPKIKKMAWWKPLPFKLHDYQEESWAKLIAEKHGNISLTTGCHAKGTPILMYGGTLKNVEDIVVGDQIMGPDSKPRNVLNLYTGIEDMLKISPIKGESFIVNRSHILSLQRTNRGNTYLRKDGTRASQENGPNPILNISVSDYLDLSKNRKHVYKLYRPNSISFYRKNDLRIPPYILGAWLGDGASANCSITTMDKEIRQEWCQYVTSLGLNISIDVRLNNRACTYRGRLKDRAGLGRDRPTKNPFHLLLESYSLKNNKHIPLEYLTASREDRLQVLAGLIDTDGYYSHGSFEIIQKNRVLADNILFLARSLGFCATKRDKISRDQNGTEGLYVRISIIGDLSSVPTRLRRKQAEPRKQIKDVLRTGFKVEPIGRGEYFGFELDGDHLYVMGDFTITHNSGKSAIILKLCQEMGLNTCIVAPGKGIFNELIEKLEFHFGKGRIGAFGDGKKKLKQINVCIGDSLANIKIDSPEYEFFSNLDVLIVDESHTFAAESLETICHGVLAKIPYRFFMSATQFRNDGSLPLLQSIIGKTVCELGTEEAVQKGYICQHEFRIVSVESSNPDSEESDPLAQKRAHFLNNTNIAKFIAKLSNAMAETHGKQTLVLCEELSQLAMLVPMLTVPYAIAHSEKRAARLEELGLSKVDVSESIEKFNKNEAKVLITTSCCHVGVNLFPTHNTFNWVGGASVIKTKQSSIGRSVRHGHSNPWASKCVPKEKAIIYDFDITGNFTMERHLEARIGCYMESGPGLIKYIRIKS